MNYKSPSVMTGILSFLLKPKSFWLAVLSANYLVYEFNATKFQIKNLHIFLLLISLEILLHYPDIDISHWLREDVHWIMDKVFKEKLMI